MYDVLIGLVRPIFLAVIVVQKRGPPICTYLSTKCSRKVHHCKVRAGRYLRIPSAEIAEWYIRDRSILRGGLEKACFLRCHHESREAKRSGRTERILSQRG